ncbi:Glyco-hydro-cc domain-containing protein [Mycena indigotica]|uniref:Glyco-hydro-cc domain-containing protein n=1 Tax=Mycena indigotica TaxID=2126181 RepID=A0A8H6SI37_9AGAR|nr:Glyco-hydro-cc domain-containing protein [Mycena indigotica]KAF7299348.1 Glyco-hydro-cc domain-containing protein [Mycena indigotica]
MKVTLAYVLAAVVASVAAAPAEVVEEKRSGPGKRGLVWPWYNSPLNPGRFNDGSGSVNLIYDYESYNPPSSNGNGGLNFIGMQRCMDCDSSPINQLAARQSQSRFATLFTLNEPDLNGISPQTAAAWYKQYINPFTIKKSLPAVSSSSSGGQGLDWVRQMIAACAGQCYYDYINIHHYGPNLQTFIDYVNRAHSMFPDKQIVVTEFALQNPPGGQADQVNFFREAFKFLDGASFVAMYFPFVATSPSLFSRNDPNGSRFVGTGSTLYNDDGSISAVGRLMLA